MLGIICPQCGENDIERQETYDDEVIDGITKIRLTYVCLAAGCGCPFDVWFVLADYEIWNEEM